VTLTGLSLSPALPRAGFPVKFTPGGNIPEGTKFSWDFGDGGAVASDLTPGHTYGNASSYVIKITATDVSGYASSYSTTVPVILNLPPKLAASISANMALVVAGRPVVLVVNATDPEQDALSYTWSIDGVQVSQDTSDVSLAYTFATGGAHSVRVVVRDEFGATDSNDFAVQVTTNSGANPPPPVVASWQNISPFMGRTRFFADDTGWVVSAAAPQALHTVDSGATWQLLTLPKSDIANALGFLDVAFADSQNGWIVGCPTMRSVQTSPNNFTLDFSWGRAVHSADGGKTWDNVPIATGAHNPSACFVAAQFIGANGWIMDASGTVMGTTDGGKTWSVLSYSDIRPARMQFVDSLHGWMTGTDLQQNQVVARTVDGGKTWITATLPNPASINHLASLSFADQNTGYVSVQGYFLAPYKLLKTTDGGVSWTELAVPTLSTTGDTLFTDATVGYTVDVYGALYKTNNGGSSWTQILANQPTAMPLDSLAIGPKNTLWATSANGGLYKFGLP